MGKQVFLNNYNGAVLIWECPSKSSWLSASKHAIRTFAVISFIFLTCVLLLWHTKMSLAKEACREMSNTWVSVERVIAITKSTKKVLSWKVLVFSMSQCSWVCFCIYVGEGSRLSSLELWDCHLRCWPRTLNRGYIFPWKSFTELYFHTLFWVCTLCPCSGFIAKHYCFSTAGPYSTFLLHDILYIQGAT